MNTLINFLQHHFFIAATSVAMFVHSTWTFNTLFAGEQPSDLWGYILWVIPGALIALAIDIGQIQTATRLRQTRIRAEIISLSVTFFVLAMAGYYLQWFHLAHHLPALELGAGLSTTHTATVDSLKSWSIWIIPALLPMSIILYTISNIWADDNPQPDSDDKPSFMPDMPWEFPATPQKPTEPFIIKEPFWETEEDTEPVDPLPDQQATKD